MTLQIRPGSLLEEMARNRTQGGEMLICGSPVGPPGALPSDSLPCPFKVGGEQRGSFGVG